MSLSNRWLWSLQKKFLLISLALMLAGASSHNPMQLLIEAIKKGNPTDVQHVIQGAKGININEQINDAGWTVLHLAAGPYGKYPDSPSICRALIAAGVNKNTLDMDGFTPLSLAIDRSNNAVVETLLKFGANPNKGAVTGDPIFVAAQKDYPDIIRLLISAGADVKGRKSNSPLTLASQAGYIETMRVLLSGGADVNSVDNANKTPLHRWCYTGKHDLEALHLLLSNGANVNALDKWRQIPLMLLLTSENNVPVEILLPALKTLIDAGSDLSIKSDYGDSALSIGLRNKNQEVVALFKKEQGR